MTLTTLAAPVRAFAPDRFGCSCCAPVLQDLTLLSVTQVAAAARPEAWKKLGPAPAAQSGTFILTGASVLTLDAAFSTVEALAVRDGRVLAVGSLDEVRAEAGEDAEVIEAAGRAILPGFVEPHMHFFTIAVMSRWANVGAIACPDADAVIDRISDLAAEAGPDRWIVARQFDPSLQAGADQITRHTLDQVAPRHPVFIFKASLHIGYCNSRALEIAGLTAETPDPPGSAFVRDEDGRPNGVLKGQPAIMAVLAHTLSSLAIDDVPEACLQVCAKANQVGVTTVCDQGAGLSLGRAEVGAFHSFAASGHMTARLRYSLSGAMADRWDEMDVKPGQGDEMARATGWKIVSDGSNQGRSGLQREPYLGGTDRGLAYVAPDDLKAAVIRRSLEGWQVVVHANGDQAIDNTLDAMEAARAAGASPDLRFRIEHCSILHDDQIRRIAALGASPSFLIGHVHYWGKAFRDEIFGPLKADLLGRAASCGKAGIRWTLHSDEPVTDMDPLRLMDNAVNRSLWKEPGGVLNPAERVSVEQAIVSLTRDAAWQCHSEHEIGSLEPGKFADFVVLDRSPLEIDPADLRSLKVLETWVAGRCVYRREAT